MNNIDSELNFELTIMFLDLWPEQFQLMRDSIAMNNGKQVEQSAHFMKGAASCLQAEKIENLLLDLEIMGKSHELSCATQVLDQVNEEMKKLRVSFNVMP